MATLSYFGIITNTTNSRGRLHLSSPACKLYHGLQVANVQNQDRTKGAVEMTAWEVLSRQLPWQEK